MDYIVFDLEWNQCPYGKKRENPALPFEIIEIGAVKLNERKEYLDSFHVLIRPAVYKRLHFQTSRVVGLKEKDLMKGQPFREAAEAFLDWCGEDVRFCTWGTLDLMELQRNLAFYHMEGRLVGPILYEDVQKLYAIYTGCKKERKSLKDAVSALCLPEDGEFHLAKEDAVYTAKVFQKIPDAIIHDYFSIDCFRNPKKKEEEICIRYRDYEKFISREFRSKEELLADSGVMTVHCFLCGRPLRRSVRYFADSGGRNYTAVGRCSEHGFSKSKVRVREAADGRYYAIRTIRRISDEEVGDIRRKVAFLKLKKQAKRKKTAEIQVSSGNS
ncbi:MAG: exonuclease domain-containing protein [Lachnospiraceae bacterium]|nr:exonuclease domain-containing protein [Lachnospiraceae bacterium]